MRRVVITGMGGVTPLGHDVETSFKNIIDGQCGISPITHFDITDFKVSLAAQVKDFDMDPYLSARERKFNDRFTQFARIAAMQAMQQAGFDMQEINPKRFGVIIGSGIGGIESIEKSKESLTERGPTRISPYFIPMALINLAAGTVAIDHQAKGICSAVVTACAAGSSAIGEAFHKIKFNQQDIMLAGGSEASITPLAIGGFMVMRALHEGSDPNRASIPFDKNRSGFVMGEGAGVVVLEELEHALKRNAMILGEIIGYGSSCDAHHITAPNPDGEGASQAMSLAIEDAGINFDAVDYINAHGTSTPLNDKTETYAIKQTFKEHAKNLSVSSTKSHLGHLLGASGAVEAIICLKSLQEGVIPATINHQISDPECDLDIVANHTKKQDIKVAMSNSLGFGGHNASLIFRKWD
jgi:3-oxoacyl-[acyl-carrier-protein] synthase II